eukprot:gene32306-41867_t
MQFAASFILLLSAIYSIHCSTHFSRKGLASKSGFEGDDDISIINSKFIECDSVHNNDKDAYSNLKSELSVRELKKEDNRSKVSRYSKRWRRHVANSSPQKPNNSLQYYSAPTYSGSNASSVEDDDDDNDGVSAEEAGVVNPDHRTVFVAECNMPTDVGVFKMRSYNYQSPRMRLEPIVLVHGNVYGKENVLVRVHDQCFTSEVFGSMRCDCREQLTASMKMIQEEGGIIVYLQQEGRGIGIANKIAAYSLQDHGVDTVDANLQLGFADEMREYFAVPDILLDMKIQSIRLITNNPFKLEQLTRLGVKVTDRVPVVVQPNKFNRNYLLIKRDRMRHFFSEDLFSEPPHFDAATGGEAFFRDSTTALLKQEQGEQEIMKQPTASSSTSTSSAPTTPPAEESPPSTPIEGSALPLEEDPVQKGSEDPVVQYEFGKESVEAAIAAIREGKIVIVVDDADRENEGDFIMAAEKATPETIGFIIRYSSGVLCISLESERLDQLHLPPMLVNNEDPKQTAYTVSVDYKFNTTTGISAADRALTFSKLCDPTVMKEDFYRPGHVFPLRYKPGGVLARAGHTEASLDLTRLAGLQGGVLAEVVHDDGSLRRLPALRELAAEKGMVLTSVRDIIAYRLETESTPQQQQGHCQ